MKITFVLPFAGLAGGVKVAAIYAQKLQQRGHDVTVVSLPPPHFPLRGKIRSFVHGRGWPGKFLSAPYLDFLGSRHKVLESHRPIVDGDLPDADVVIATWWETAEWVASLSAHKGKKFYFLQDYEIFPHLDADRVAATYTLPLKKIAVSSYVKDMLQKNHGISDVGIVPNSVDLDKFSSPGRERNSNFTVGFLYQVRPSKNTQLAIKAVRTANEEFMDLEVISFGGLKPRKIDRFPRWIDYHFRPEQDRIPNIYAACDVWLFTSAAEGFGLPILEAMASGTPVIATRAGAAPDLIDGTNGMLADATSEAFLENIRFFAKMNDADWKQFSDNARKRAEAYSWDDATDLLEGHLVG